MTASPDRAGLLRALKITADALDSAAEDAHAGWAYYAGDDQTTHSGPDDFAICLDSNCRRRQRYVEDARAALASPDRAGLRLDDARLARALHDGDCIPNGLGLHEAGAHDAYCTLIAPAVAAAYGPAADEGHSDCGGFCDCYFRGKEAEASKP